MAKKKEEVVEAPTAVRVRMYRQGLGDCFLLRFSYAHGPAFHMVIDCGLVYGAKGGKERMKQVTENILQEAQGSIDVLVITHEHYDHVSGFSQADVAWNGMVVNEVWMAWTEDPDDALAKSLRRAKEAKVQAFQAELQKFTGVGAFYLDGARMARVNGALGFMGANLLSAANGIGLTRKAMDAARKGNGSRTPRYCMPGSVLKDIPGVRVYVMGPPHNEAQLKRSDPSKGEAYGGQGNLLGYADSNRAGDPDRPFAHGMGDWVNERAYDSRFKKAFGGSILGHSDDRARTTTERNKNKTVDEQWRRLPNADGSELEKLAMALDDATNNTSLVLAFELPDDRVLLFAADAQAGNWASWHELKWTPQKTGRKAAATTTELLNRTVLYKVGHHLSHNGTLKDLGLELMQHRDLVALVTLDKQQAIDKGYGRTMPWPSLSKRLTELTRGRIFLTDTKVEAPDAMALTKLSKAERKAFAERTDVNDLYIDINL